jgi:hypothetical protein
LCIGSLACNTWSGGGDIFGVGGAAARNVTTGDQNTAVGISAIGGGNSASALTGPGNTAVGDSSLYQIGGTACCNTAIGANSGKLTNYNGGSHNDYFGYGVAESLGGGTTQTESRDIVIGTDSNCTISAAGVSDEFDLCASTSTLPLMQGNLAAASLYLAVNGPVKVSPGYTVSGLPSGHTGDRAYVTDATACTFGGTLTGGASTICPVFYNGAAWVEG